MKTNIYGQAVEKKKYRIRKEPIVFALCIFVSLSLVVNQKLGLSKMFGTSTIEANAESTYKKRKTTTTTAKINVSKNKSTFELGVTYIDMLNEGIVEGCEGGAVLSALWYKGYAKNYDLKTFYKYMPHTTDSNPHNGFVGSEYQRLGSLQTIYPDALIDYVKTLGDAELTNGASCKDLVNDLKQGNPSIVWVTSKRLNTPKMRWYPWGTSVRNTHTVLLVGYNNKTGAYKVMDSGGHRGSYWVSKSRFEASYNAMKYAITVY